MRTYKKVLLYLLIAIGTLGILDTILVMRFSSGISVGVLAPGIIGIGLILFSILNLRKKTP